MRMFCLLFATTSIFYISVNPQALSSDAFAAIRRLKNSKKVLALLREKEAHTHLKQCRAECCGALAPKARRDAAPEACTGPSSKRCRALAAAKKPKMHLADCEKITRNRYDSEFNVIFCTKADEQAKVHVQVRH